MSVMSVSCFVWAVVVLLCAVLGSAASAVESHVVHVLDAPPYFDPLTVEAKVGDTVIWKNHGPELPHIIINKDVTLSSDDIPVGKEWAFTFKRAGVYSYICLTHFFMRGTIVVRNSDGTTDPVPEYSYQVAFKEFVVPTPKAVPRMIIAIDFKKKNF